MSQISLTFEAATSFDSSALMVRDSCGTYRVAIQDEILQAAQGVLAQQIRGTHVFDAPKAIKEFLAVKLGTLEHEVFSVLMLNSQHRLIEYVELFRGTVSQTSVYPREVIKEALRRNAAAVILVHNHPSGLTDPSNADKALTSKLKAALELVDVRVLDHFIVAGSNLLSFAEQGLI